MNPANLTWKQRKIYYRNEKRKEILWGILGMIVLLAAMIIGSGTYPY